jgi:flagellar biosynthesis protein FlhG
MVQPQNPYRKVILTIGGGKGGSGKSFITANLGISLAKLGARVVLIDADLGGANLHTFFGILQPTLSLSDFIKKRVSRLREALLPTGVPNLQLLAGGQELLNAADAQSFQRQKIMKAIRTLEGDFILVDLGAGTSMGVLDFFLISDGGILVMTPEPTSIENAYRFLKSAFYRRLKQYMTSSPVRELIGVAMDLRNEMGIRNPFDLIDAIKKVNEEAAMILVEGIKTFEPCLILNQVWTKQEVDIGFSIRSACQKYFGIQLRYLGYIVYDQEVGASIRKKSPLILGNARSRAAQCVMEIGSRLANGYQMSFPFE